MIFGVVSSACQPTFPGPRHVDTGGGGDATTSIISCNWCNVAMTTVGSCSEWHGKLQPAAVRWGMQPPCAGDWLLPAVHRLSVWRGGQAARRHLCLRGRSMSGVYLSGKLVFSTTSCFPLFTDFLYEGGVKLHDITFVSEVNPSQECACLVSWCSFQPVINCCAQTVCKRKLSSNKTSPLFLRWVHNRSVPVR